MRLLSHVRPILALALCGVLSGCIPLQVQDEDEDEGRGYDWDDGAGSDDGGGPGGPTDSDGDGYAASDDCDDSDSDIHPEAEEVCDGLDNDCDDLTDEDDEDLVGGDSYYLDADGDGFGSPVAQKMVVACERPDGYAAQGGDCDDEDDEVNPGATDRCGDGVDSDCDGSGGRDDDEDGDGLDWSAEDTAGTDACNEDTDGDGLSDGDELTIGTDPLDQDTDGDGLNDSEDPDPLSMEAQYQLFESDLINLTIDCSSVGHLYNYCNTEDFGFEWESVGTRVPSSVVIRFLNGITCHAGSEFQTWLNSGETGSVVLDGSCDCNPVTSEVLVSLTAAEINAFYSVGDTNQFLIESLECEGLSPNSDWGADVYALVDVVY